MSLTLIYCFGRFYISSIDQIFLQNFHWKTIHSQSHLVGWQKQQRVNVNQWTMRLLVSHFLTGQQNHLSCLCSLFCTQLCLQLVSLEMFAFWWLLHELDHCEPRRIGSLWHCRARTLAPVWFLAQLLQSRRFENNVRFVDSIFMILRINTTWNGFDLNYLKLAKF